MRRPYDTVFRRGDAGHPRAGRARPMCASTRRVLAPTSPTNRSSPLIQDVDDQVGVEGGTLGAEVDAVVPEEFRVPLRGAVPVDEGGVRVARYSVGQHLVVWSFPIARFAQVKEV